MKAYSRCYTIILIRFILYFYHVILVTSIVNTINHWAVLLHWPDPVEPISGRARSDTVCPITLNAEKPKAIFSASFIFFLV